MGEIRRGAAAVQEAVEANENREGGTFRPFLPSIFWKENNEARYLLFLNTIDELYQFDTISFIPTENGFPETVVAKTDTYFGEKTDRFEKEWDASIRVTDFMVAVELEPTLEVVKGRKRPKGFEVATKTFERRILDDDGNVTDDTEEVTTPIVGLIAQSPYNFYNIVKSYDATKSPIHETAVEIIRIGTDQNTAYSIYGYEDQEIDLSNFINYVDGITYLDDIDEVVEEVDKLDPWDAIKYVGNILLDKRVAELLDEDRYDELFEGVTESMDKFGNKRKKNKGKDKKPERKARPSQRRKPVEVSDGDTPEDLAEPEDTDAVEPEEKPKATRTRRAAAKKEAPKEESVTRESPAKERLNALREKAAKDRAKKAEND